MIENTEIASLMGAVQRAGTSLSDEILQIISASAEPMCCKDIYEKSVNAPDTMTLSIEVHRMTVKAGLLEIVETKKREGFRPVAFYRLTELGHEQLRMPGADMHKPASELQKNVTELQESAPKVKPTASIPSKENAMNEANRPGGSGKQPGALNKAIHDKIIGHPGITETALIKHVLQQLPGTTEKQVRKTMSNMRHVTKKIRTEGERGNLTYHLNTGVKSTPAKAAKPASKVGTGKRVAVGKVVTGAEAASLRGDPPAAKTPASLPVVKQEAEPDFELLLSDENCLHINLGGDKFRLNPNQLARLDAFLGRVLPDGVRVADGARA